MGTRFELLLPLSGSLDAPRARAAGEAALRAIQDWHAALTPHDPASTLSFIHRTAFSRPASLDPDLFSLFDLALRVRTLSNAAFDPCWQTPTLAPKHGPTHPPGYTLDPATSTIRLHSPDTRIDPASFGKGFALDAAAAELASHGIRDAFLHGGTSSILALGTPTPDEPRPSPPGWRVQLAGTPAPHPTSPTRLLLANRCLSVSAQRGHHADPASRLSLGPTAATHAAAIGPSNTNNASAACDAWSTAALVASDRGEAPLAAVAAAAAKQGLTLGVYTPNHPAHARWHWFGPAPEA
jgi:thiamine biosynthesis lipoprotein